MFADNEVISSRQLRCQLTLGMLGVFLLVLPGFGEIEGMKGVICCIIGGILVAVYCFFLVRIAPAYRNLEKILGKWGLRVVGGWFLSFFIITGAFLVNVISDVIGVYLVTGSFPYLMHGMILFACAMAGIPQIQRRGRMAEVCFGVFVGILVALLLLCMLQQDWKYLGQELLQENILRSGKLAFGTYAVFAAFTGIGALPFLLSNVKDHKCKSMIGAVAILTGFLAAVLLLLQGAYGTAQVEDRPWPLISLIAGIRIPGTLLARFDPLWIALFLMLMLFSIGSTLFYSNYIAKRTELPLKWYWILLAVYLISVVDIDGYSVKRDYKTILLYLYTPSILLLNLLIGWWSRRRVSGKYLTLCVLGLFLSVLGTTGTGCSRVEPELRAYPLAMGFDWADGKYNVYYAMPDLSTFTGEGKTADTTDLLWVYEGADYEEIEQEVRQTKQQKLDLGHVQVILFGEDLLENSSAYDATMNYLLDQPVLGSGSYVFDCPDLAAVMGENGNITDSLGEYLADLIKKEKLQPAVVQDLYNAWYNKEALPQLMTVRIRDGQMEVEGIT